MIRKIFDEKGWDFYSDDIFSNAFDNATEIHSNLRGTKKDLFEELLRLYDFISLDQYLLLMKNMTEILLNIVNKTDRIYFLPLISGLDDTNNDIIFSTPDSSSLITYIQRSLNLEMKRETQENIYFKSDSKDIFNGTFKRTVNKNGYIVISDDFSGSGLSIVNAIKTLERRAKELKTTFLQENIIVFVLVMTNKAIQYIEKNFPKVKIIFGRKAITIFDIYEGEENIIKQIMEISQEFSVKKNHELGFDNTGCLVSLLRTPNNTLGIFRDGDYPIFKRGG